MEQNKNVLKNIYNTLKANNAFQQAKSFDEFAAKMKYPGYNNQMYNYFTKNGGKTTISRWRAATGYTAPAKPHSRLVEQAMNFGSGVKVNDSEVRAPFKPEDSYVSAKPYEDKFEPVRDAVEIDPEGRKVHVAKPIAEDYKKVTNGKFTPAKQQVVDKKGKVVAEHDIYPIQPAEVELDQQLKAYDKQMKAADAQEKKQLADAKKRAENDYNTAVSKEMNKKRSFWQMLGDEMVSANMAQHGINYDPQFERGKNSEAARNAQARLDMIDSAQKIINEVRSGKTDKDGLIGFVQGSGRGFRDSALSSKTWSFGARDANESLQLLGAIMANDNGVATKEQKELLNVAAMKAGVEGKYSDLLGRGYKAGQVTGESLPFMVEIMMNPASGLGKGAQQGLGKYLIKKYGKNAVEKNIKKYAAAKIATRVGTDIFAGYGMALTSGIGHTTAETARRMQGDIQTDVDENGNTVYAGHTKGKTFGAALGEGLTTQAIENQSEFVGEYFEPVGKVLGKWLGKGAGKVMGKVDRALVGTKAEPFYNTARKFVTSAVESKGLASFAKNMKDFQKKTKWNGTLGEYLEEVVGNVENALTVGDNDFSTEKGKGVFNLSDNIDTFLGVSLMGGAFAGIKSVAWGVYKARGGAKGVARRTMNDIDKKLQGNEKWSIIKKSIDLAKDDGLALNDILTDVMTSKMSKDEKNLVLNYAKNQQVLRGAEMATYKPRTASVKRTEKDGKFGVEWYDKNGNAIDSRSFDSKERADAYEQELLDERDHYDMRNMYDTATGLNMQEAVAVVNPEDEGWRNKAAEKAKEKEDKAKAAIAKFEQDNGLEKGAVGKMLDKEAWELTDEESAYVPALKSLLKDLAYPTNVVNEEHFEEEGAEMADDAGFENDTPNVDVAQAARQEYEAAKAAYEKALNNNEILKDEVQSRLNKGMKPADILMDLEGFTDEELDTVARFFNADAKFNGFMNQTQKNIQNAVGEKVDEHTFRGTINGVPDTKNRVKISNGKETFTLIGGELTTDDNGNVVDRGKTNLVVARNSEGDLVLLPSTDKLTILPNSQTLEDFGNQLYQELGANATEAIDPNNDLVQSQAEAATEQVQPAVEATNDEEVNPSEEAAQEEQNVEGAPITEVETPTNGVAQPVSEETQPVSEEAEPQQEKTKPVIPTDKDGVKLYENGIDAGDALGDMLENGDNPTEIADAAIAESNEAINAINSKKTKSRKDLVVRKKHEQTKKYYEDLKSNHTHVDLGNGYSSELYGDNRGFILKDGKIIYDSEGKYAPIPTEEELNALMPAESEENVNNADIDSNEAGNTVSSQDGDRVKAAKAKYGDNFDDDFSHANDVMELVSMFFGKGRNLAWTDVNGKRGLQKELGWTRKVGGDTKAIETFLAKNGEGMGIDDFVHMIWESSENDGRFDTQEIKNAVIGLIQSAQTKSDITDYMYNSRVGAAEKAYEAEQRAQENGAMDEEAPVSGELADDEMPFPMPTDEELDTIFNDNNDDTRQGNESVDGTDMPEHQGEVENNAESGAETQGEQLDVSGSEGQDSEDEHSESGEVQNVDASSAGSSVATGAQQDRGTSAVQEGVSTTHKGEDNGEKPTTRETKEGKGEVKESSDNPLETAEKVAAERNKKAKSEKKGSGNKIFTDEAHAEVLKKLKAKLNQLNAGFDPELALLMLQDAGYHVEKGARSIAACAKAMIEELGDIVRPYIRSAYYAVREYPEMKDIAKEMSSNDEINAFDPYNFDKKEEVKENSVKEEDYSFLENNEPVEYKGDGKRHSIISIIHSGEQVSATQFSKPRLEKVYITDNKGGMIEAKPEDLTPYKDKSNPVETAKAITEERKQEKAKSEEKTQAKKKVAHKLVSDERYEELKKRMREKLYGQMNMGIDPEILAIGAEMAVYHIEAGAIKFADYAKKMIEDLGEAIRPYLKSFYNAVRDMPEAQDFSKKMDSYADVAEFNVLTFDQKEAKTVNDNKKENNKAGNDVSLQQKELTSEAKSFAENRVKEDSFIDDVRNKLVDAAASGEKLTIVQLRKLAEAHGLEADDKKIQELVELAIVSNAREVMSNDKLSNKEKFDSIVSQYYAQPTISQRDTDRINLQQFSTPTPMAALMDIFLNDSKEVNSVLEPTAGNGALVIGFPVGNVHVNEIDKDRRANLLRQGFRRVTNQLGQVPFEGEKVDVVVSNPPFGSLEQRLPDGTRTEAKPMVVDGYEFTALDHVIAVNALASMKDNGRAAIIVGGNTEYKDNGSIQGKKDKSFLGYLYNHYNVVDVINIDGALYGKQGTTYPVRMILIDGRRTDTTEKKYAPTKSNARAEQVTSFDELYNRVDYDIQNFTKDGSRISIERSSDTSNVDNSIQGEDNLRESSKDSGVDVGERDRHGDGKRTARKSKTSGRVRALSFDFGDSGEQAGSRETSQGDTKGNLAGREAARDDRQDSNTEGGKRGVGGIDTKSVGNEHTSEPKDNRPNGGREKRELVKVELGQDKAPYVAQSEGTSLGTVMPATMIAPVQRALSRINGGDVDSFVQEKLGYSSREELYEHLGAEQIDGVAMAIHQMEGGSGFIIGDGTGVGKGRQAASILRYAIRQGKTPIFVTQKAGLFTDMYRDMVDIGAADLFHPLIINSTDDEVDIKEGAPAAAKYFKGNAKKVTVDGVEYRKITDKETGEEEIFKIVAKGLKSDKGKSIQELIDGLKETGKLPNGYTFVMVTYSQLTSGTQEYVNGEAKAKRKKGNKAYTSGEIIGDKKRELLKLIAKDNFVVLDESHTAAGNSAGYFMDMTKEAKGVTFLSGTFAKNPDCMPLYAMKTAISKAGLKVSDLIEAVRNGGNTLQEIMSRALSESGQMVHRERPLDGVVNNWVQDEDKEKIEKDRKRFDAITEIFNMAIAFQENYVDPAIERLRQTASLMQGDVEKTSGTDKMGIDNEPFVSGTYQLVRQLLFAVKAEQIADTAIKSIKEGRKPVIAISNTMGRFTEDLPLGEDVTMPDFSETIGAKIGNLLKYTRVDDQGNKIPYSFNLKDLGEGAEEAYKALEDKISQSSSGLGISPIDTIKNKIRKAGYSVGELTGRKEEIIFNEDGSVRKVTRRDTNKKVQTNKFNNGELDVVILNKSASTGISLHSNVKFGDTRQREMIIGQLEEDVNDAIQMLGRVNRTGQVSAPIYTYLISNVPAEQRLMMMYKTKVKSLFANTSGNQDAKDAQVEVPDMLNKYGTQVVWNYLIEHRDIYNMLADPLGWGSQEAVLEASEDDLRKNMPNNEIGGETIRKVTGRMALLPSNLQEQVLNAINEEYQTMINILDEAGENDLKMNELPLNATTKSKGVWIKGNEPNGENIFADNTNVETVEMDVLKKPMTEEEISKSIDRMQEGKDWETWRDEKKAELDAYEEKELKEIDEKNEARAKLAGEREYLKVHDSIKNILSRIEKKRKEGKDLTDKEKAYENFTEKDVEEAANNAKQSKYDEVRSRLNTLQANIRAKVRGFKDKLDKFTPGKIIIVPSDLRDNAETSFTMERGTLIGFKFNKDWTPSSSTAIFATTDGRRKVEIPLSKSHALSLIQQASFAFAGQLQAMKLSDWGKMATTKSRKQGHIITGNILAGIDKINKMGLFGARLVRYTTSEGDIVDGILMPDNFNVNSLKGGAAISTKLNDILNGKKVTSIDKKVEVGKKYSWEPISLRVPKSKAEGGQYWNDEELLGLVDGKFHTHAGMMEAVVPNENLEKVLNLLSTKFGVQVPVDVDLNDSKVRYSDDISFAEAMDMQRNLREAAKKAMPNTKVVDENGNPKVVYHFTDARGIKVFDHEHGSGKHGVVLGRRFYFTPNSDGEEVKYGKNMMPVYLNIENPYNASEGLSEDFINEHDATLQELFGKDYKENSYVMEKLTSPRGLVDLEGAFNENVVERLGFDGIYYGGGWMDDEQWAVSNPNQIKSARAFEFDDNGELIPVKDRFDFGNNDIRYSDDNDNAARAKNAERVQKTVSDTVKALGGGKHVVQVRSIDDVPDDIRQHIEERHAKGKRVTGWYRNGKVYLFMPDITNSHEAVVTILHELVGHKGMLEVFGKVGYQNVMRALWMNGPKEMRTWVNEHVDERGWDFYEAMDEYLADEAEKGGKLGFWQNIRRVLTEALNKLGIPVDLNIYDTKYLLWLAKNQIKEGEPMSAARRNAVLRKIKAQNVSAITYNGRVYDNSNLSQEERDIFSEDESIGENDTPTAMNAKAFYHSMLKRASFVWNEAYADYMASLKILQKALGGENIPDSQNAYMAENAMSSQNQQEGEKYIKECVKPLEEIINKCIGLMGWKLADLERYIYVKHGLERNRVFAFRDWYNNEIKRVVSDVTELNEREQEIYTKKVDAITTDFEDGKINEEQRDKKIEKAINEAHKEYLDEVLSEWKDMRKQAKEKLDNGSYTLADYYGEMDNFLSQYAKDDWDAGKNDMSGLSSMYGDENGDIDDAELISRVMDIEGSLTDENVAELWKRINAATRFAIDKEYESGLMTEDSYDRVNGMFDFYVPLRLFAEDTAEDVYQYMTGKGNISQYVGKTLKHAKGRKSEAKHPIATIFAMATKAISNGNRNLMKQRFARLVRATYEDNDTDRLVTEQEVYLENVAADGEPDNWIVAYPSLLDEHGEPLTDPDEIMDALNEFNEYIAQKRKEGKIKKVTDSGDIPYKVLSDKDKMEHVVEVRIAGRPHLFVINGDPRAAQAINGQLNPSAGAYKLFSALNGMMSAAFTSYSITFAMRNMTRDFEFFGAALNTKEGSEYTKAATKYYAELMAHNGIAEKKKDLIMPTIHVLFRKYKEGTLNMDNELERDFKDFVDNGGVTGYTQMKNVDDWHKDLEKIVKRLGAKGAKKAVYATGDVISAIGGFVDGVNEGIENMARFATYRASRHKAGRSILRSVSDAKDVTVNFNRKGAGAKTAKYAHSMNAKVAGHSAQFFRGTKLFFNATMQAIMNFFNMAKKHPVKAIRNLASVPFAIGVAAPLINSMLFSLFGGDGDDPYADLPEFERRSNWCIYVGNNSFIKIPISQEMKPFLGLGDLLAGYIYNPNLQSLDKNALEQITELMALYSPIDVNTSRYGEDGITGAFMNLLIPQSFSPVVEVATNTSWTNRPIQKENEYNQNAPEYKKAYRNTNSSVVELSRKWHELFGGDEAKRADLAIGEISPAYAQYLVQQYSGGVGSFIMSSGENINSFAKLLRGEDVDFNIRTVEGAKAFLTQGDDRTIMNRTRTKYYKYLDDAKKTDYVASVYRQEMKGGNALSAAKLHALQRSNEFKSAKLVERYSRYLKKLDQAKDAAKRDSEKKMLQKLYNDKLQECVSKLDSLKNGGSN